MKKLLLLLLLTPFLCDSQTQTELKGTFTGTFKPFQDSVRGGLLGGSGDNNSAQVTANTNAIGNISLLNTSNKSNLVSAINEITAGTTGTVVSTVTNVPVSKNLYNPNADENGYYFNQGVSKDGYGSAAVSDFIRVIPGAYYIASGAGYTNSGFGQWYDSLKVFVAPAYVFEGGIGQSLKAPVNAYYFSFTTKTNFNSTSGIQFEQARTPTAFQPYTTVSKGLLTGNTVNALYQAKVYDIDYSNPFSVVNKGYVEWLHANVKATTGKKAIFFGDSITDENGGATGFFTNWPSVAAPLLGLASYKNYAWSGAKIVAGGDANQRLYLNGQLNAALADTSNHPDIIVIAIGRNDIRGGSPLGTFAGVNSIAPNIATADKSTVYGALQWSLSTLRTAYPNAMIFVSTPIQTANNGDWDIFDTGSQSIITALTRMGNKYNAIIINSAYESGIVTDYETQGANGRYLGDGTHPNETGKSLLGKYIATQIIKNYSSSTNIIN